MTDIKTPVIVISEWVLQKTNNIASYLKAMGKELDRLYSRHKKEETEEIKKHIETLFHELESSILDLSEMLGGDENSIAPVREQALNDLFSTMNGLGIMSQRNLNDFTDLDRLALTESFKFSVRKAKK